MYAMIASPAQAAPVPPADVIREVKFFNPDVVYKKTIETKNGAYYEFGRKYKRVYVNVKTGKVNNYSWPYNHIKGKNDVDQKTAEMRIRAWLKDRKVSLAGWTSYRKETHEIATDLSEHMFEFVKKARDGIILDSRIAISMYSDGNLGRYLYIDNPVTISLKPKYSKRKFVSIAIRNSKLKNAGLKSYELRVSHKHYDMSNQTLYAVIVIKGNPAHPEIAGSDEVTTIIDAHTGKVTDTLLH